jgi:light-regulated signal transduction histidine kinase (bacteriophytochrome)
MTGVIWTGSADLTNCDREPIHIPGSIQSHGVMLACERANWRVTHASANAASVFDLPAAKALNVPLKTLLGPALFSSIEASLSSPAAQTMTAIATRLFGVKVKGRADKFDLSVHQHGGRVIVELERAEAEAGTPPLDLVRIMLTKLQQSRTLNELCEETVHQLRALIGYDRVMIYRFLHDGTGQVIAESKCEDISTMLGLRYPASDIPAQARELYKRNWVRLIADVASAPVSIKATVANDEGPLDLSHAEFRSVSPIHIEYLTNMGVGASMSISIIVGGELWGLIACHHKVARRVPANVRAACELLGQVFSLQIQTVEGIEAYVTMRAARALLDRVVAEFPIEGNLIENLAIRLEQISSFVTADGVGILVDGVWRGTGLCPSPTETKLLAKFIDGQRTDGRIFADHHLSVPFQTAESWRCGVRGVLAIPLSYEGGNWLFFFRREVAQTIEWGGDPSKPVVANASGRISPRKSFEAWKQDVRGQSLPWTSRERLIADTLRVYLLDIIVRFSEVIIEERRQSQQRHRLLASELNHRVKATLELIQSLIHHGYEEQGKIQSFVRRLEGRIRAVALAHDAAAVSSGSEVRNLVEGAVALEGIKADRIDIEGPDARVDAKAYMILALVVHELASTASRGGVMDGPECHLYVRWFLDASGQLVFLWEESGSARGRRSQQDELSASIIRRNIPHALGGEADVVMREGGLKATFVIPARHLVNVPPVAVDAARRQQIASSPALLEGYSVLILEDQTTAAIDLEKGLRDRGAVAVNVAGTVSNALSIIASDPPDVAVLDVDLDGETSLPVAEELVRIGIPFVFAAAKRDRDTIGAQFGDVAVIDKPYSAEAVANSLKDALLPHLIRAVLNRLV